MEYAVKITETLVKIVKVDASSLEEARSKVKDAYMNEDIVLGADDYVDHDIIAMDQSEYANDPGQSDWEKI